MQYPKLENLIIIPPIITITTLEIPNLSLCLTITKFHQLVNSLTEGAIPKLLSLMTILLGLKLRKTIILFIKKIRGFIAFHAITVIPFILVKPAGIATYDFRNIRRLLMKCMKTVQLPNIVGILTIT